VLVFVCPSDRGFPNASFGFYKRGLGSRSFALRISKRPHYRQAGSGGSYFHHYRQAAALDGFWRGVR
jgi:hypothetical protein